VAVKQCNLISKYTERRVSLLMKDRMKRTRERSNYLHFWDSCYSFAKWI